MIFIKIEKIFLMFGFLFFNNIIFYKSKIIEDNGKFICFLSKHQEMLDFING
jgi:hypothetical protein